MSPLRKKQGWPGLLLMRGQSMSAMNNVPESRPMDAYLASVHAEADEWAECERERDLMAVLVEAAQFKSAARAWHRRRELDSGSRP
jgi:hypothetical protein